MQMRRSFYQVAAAPYHRSGSEPLLAIGLQLAAGFPTSVLPRVYSYLADFPLMTFSERIYRFSDL